MSLPCLVLGAVFGALYMLCGVFAYIVASEITHETRGRRLWLWEQLACLALWPLLVVIALVAAAWDRLAWWLVTR